jgi:hypothetical protein
MVEFDPSAPSSTSKATRPSPSSLAVKTALLSVSTPAGIPHRVKAVRKLATTAPIPKASSGVATPECAGEALSMRQK